MANITGRGQEKEVENYKVLLSPPLKKIVATHDW